MPPRGTPEFWAMSLVDQVLLQGDDSRLTRVLVKELGLTGSVDGGINLLGNAFNYAGPMLWTAYLLHDVGTTPARVLEAIDLVVGELHERPIGAEVMDRARVKLRSSLYDAVGAYYGFGRADLLASFALFDGDPDRINGIEAEFDRVTPELIRTTARRWLRPENRTVLTIVAGAPAGEGGE
jgi:predicted Zn-dependent peptidase